MSTQLLLITHVPMLCFGSHLLLFEGPYSPSSSSSCLCRAHFSIFPTERLHVDVPQILKCNMLKVNSPLPLATNLIFFFLPFLITMKDIVIYPINQVRNLEAILAFVYFCLLPPPASPLSTIDFILNTSQIYPPFTLSAAITYPLPQENYIFLRAENAIHLSTQLHSSNTE